MNYTLIRQRESQQGCFSQRQLSVCTIYLTVGKEHCNIAIINDSMECNVTFVYCTQKMVVDYVKENILFVKNIIYVRQLGS